MKPACCRAKNRWTFIAIARAPASWAAMASSLGSALGVSRSLLTRTSMSRKTAEACAAMAARVTGAFKVRALGSATLHLAYVAAGLLDGCVDFNVKIWDLAAAIPLVRAAGGEVRFLNGEQLPLRTFDLKMRKIVYLAGTPTMAARLGELMRP